MENKIKRPQLVARVMSKYIYIHTYIYLYPAIYFIGGYYFGNIFQFLTLYSNVIAAILLGSSFLFIPALIWFAATKIFKQIHPIVVIIYFSFFILLQIMALYLILIFIAMAIGSEAENI